MPKQRKLPKEFTAGGKIGVVELYGGNWIDAAMAIAREEKNPRVEMLALIVENATEPNPSAWTVRDCVSEFERHRMTVCHLRGSIAGFALTVAAECRLVIGEPTCKVLTPRGWTLAEQLEGRGIDFLQTDPISTLAFLTRVLARRT